RRDLLRPRYLFAESRRARLARLSPAHARHARRHPLSAPAELHRARLRPCAAGRPHRAFRQKRTGVAARRKRLRLARGRTSIDVARSAHTRMSQVAERTGPVSAHVARYLAEYQAAK